MSMMKRVLAAALAAPAALLGCSLSLPTESARSRGGRGVENPLPRAGTVASMKAGQPLFGVLFDISDPSLPPGEKAGDVLIGELLLSIGADGSIFVSEAGEKHFLYRAADDDDDDDSEIVDLGWQETWPEKTGDETADWITRKDKRVGNFGALLPTKDSALVWENRTKAGTTLGNAWAITLRFADEKERAEYFTDHSSQLVDGVLCVLPLESWVFDPDLPDGEKWQLVIRDTVCQYRYNAWQAIVYRFGK